MPGTKQRRYTRFDITPAMLTIQAQRAKDRDKREFMFVNGLHSDPGELVYTPEQLAAIETEAKRRLWYMAQSF